MVRNSSVTPWPSMASRITVWPMRQGDALPSACPSTMTTLASSSMPADAEARRACRSQRRSTAASVASAWLTSPSATATPSAEAPRDQPMES